MIPSIRIQNFKCLKSVDIDLGQFTVFVGPNGSGKTAALEALQLYAVGEGSMPVSMGARIGTLLVDDSLLAENADDAVIQVPAKDSEQGYAIVTLGRDSRDFMSLSERAVSRPGVTGPRLISTKRKIKAACYRFDPRELKEPSKASWFQENSLEMGLSGERFCAFLNEFLRRDRKTFFALEEEFYKRFPEYVSFNIEPRDRFGERTYEIRFRTRSGAEFPAAMASDGEILSLAYLAVCHQPDPPSLLLVEEPENGVHYGRLKEIVETLRRIASEREIQVVLTTHSPYLLDLVKPEDVRVFHRTPGGGTTVTRMSDAKDIADLQKHFMTGEIWTMETEDRLVAKDGK